jgi:uroporphyrinogen decarboxylase
MTNDFAENDFRRLRIALERGMPDRVPCADVDINPTVKAQFLGRPVDSIEVEVEFWVKAGYDFVGLDKTVWEYEALDPRAKEATYDYASTGEESKRGWVSEGTGVIRSLEDVEVYPWPTEDLDYSVFDDLDRVMPSSMKAIPLSGGLLTTSWGLIGFEDFCMALYENPELIEAVMARVGALVLRSLERITEFECVGAVWFADDIAYTEGLIFSPEHLRKYFFPWLREAVKICKRHDLPFIYHTDGQIWEVMEDIIEAGVDAIQPIEPKAMDIVEVKRRYGDRLGILGNIDLGYTLTMGTPAEVEAEVQDRIRSLGPGGGYIVSSSNSIPEYVPVDNFRAMVEATRKYGNYPISGDYRPSNIA